MKERVLSKIKCGVVKNNSLGSVDILDHVILSEARAKNLRIVWPILADGLEILRRCAPQNDMFGEMSTEPS
jgi:hypothetical protein